MPSPSDEDWHDALAEQRRAELVRDAIGKELARAYAPVVDEPLPPEMMRLLGGAPKPKSEG